MLYQEPFVLYLNITVIIILFLMILPTLLNQKEKLSVKISFSMIFFIVIINCISNLLIFYFENSQLLFLQFSLMIFPYLFGPSMFFYVKYLVDEGKIKNFYWHFLLPIMILIFGTFLMIVNYSEQKIILDKIIASQYLPYTIINGGSLAVSIYYLVISKKTVKKLRLNPNSEFYIQKKLKKDWANEFVNYMMFSVISFFIIDIVGVVFFNMPQVNLDLILMPIYFLVIYSIIMVRNMVISKESEILYIRSKAENEKKLIEQRISISRDLHDNIGAYTNSLMSKIDYLKTAKYKDENNELGELKENAGIIMSLLRQTIWVLNNDEVNAESFYDYVKQYAMKNFMGTAIKVNFEENITENKIIESQKVIQIFRIIQEIFQNILKHSQAKQVNISLYCSEILKIIIKDDGIGFEKEAQKEGYGFKNMRARALEAHLELEITSNKSLGTEATIIENFK